MKLAENIIQNHQFPWRNNLFCMLLLKGGVYWRRYNQSEVQRPWHVSLFIEHLSFFLSIELSIKNLTHCELRFSETISFNCISAFSFKFIYQPLKNFVGFPRINWDVCLRKYKQVGVPIKILVRLKDILLLITFLDFLWNENGTKMKIMLRSNIPGKNFKIVLFQGKIFCYNW